MPSNYAQLDGGRRDVTSNPLTSLTGNQAASPAKQRILTGPQRAAILMLALGDQHGAKIWSLLDDDELREISIIMSTIGTIEAELVENLCLNLCRACRPRAP